jgi:hypothetical protein
MRSWGACQLLAGLCVLYGTQAFGAGNQQDNNTTCDMLRAHFETHFQLFWRVPKPGLGPQQNPGWA